MTCHVETATSTGPGHDCWVTCTCGFQEYYPTLSAAATAIREHLPKLQEAQS